MTAADSARALAEGRVTMYLEHGKAHGNQAMVDDMLTIRWIMSEEKRLRRALERDQVVAR
jgi:hypothetical protein